MTGPELAEAGRLLAAARRPVVFTGAGMSAESGVPTFRDAQTGLWQRYDPQELATPAAFRADPALVWGWYEARRHGVRRARPNPGHRAVAAIRARCPETVVITQNVDDLHERGGVPAPVRLHGSLFAPRCSACARPAPLPSDLPPPSDAPVPFGSPEAHDEAEPHGGPVPHAPEPHDGPLTPPACAGCGAPVRPGVVWFGEALPSAALDAAVEAASGCDLLLTVGTSALVHPAAEIPLVAARLGAPVVQVNPVPTPLDAICAVNLRGPAGEVLPALVRAAWPDADAG
ncbi:SIR2 family NAD-dependent protein deacylase [Micromonospora aurantiaca]|uniref:SIR2 family NAD-dependent protein deacylase n=1 Tax=Micromonospora TaxID=1873 RepID=UPI0008D97313|nr:MULTISPECIES: Sir2 family NAD-dependent protein deacetylase [Micromonospora]OHX02148.1 NAD-dependent deacylase [Micromonospora sp. WMMB235]RNI00502.1 NAD-dependent deacylase [Micromonospora aurantiaca]